MREKDFSQNILFWEIVFIKIEKKNYNFSGIDVGDGVKFVDLFYILLFLYYRQKIQFVYLF